MLSRRQFVETLARCPWGPALAGPARPNGRQFADFMIDDIKCSPDGACCDVAYAVYVSTQGAGSA
jgi:hypothetical protein